MARPHSSEEKIKERNRRKRVANGGEGLEALVISRWTGLHTSNHHTRTYDGLTAKTQTQAVTSKEKWVHL